MTRLEQRLLRLGALVREGALEALRENERELIAEELRRLHEEDPIRFEVEVGPDGWRARFLPDGEWFDLPEEDVVAS